MKIDINNFNDPAAVDLSPQTMKIEIESFNLRIPVQPLEDGRSSAPFTVGTSLPLFGKRFEVTSVILIRHPDHKRVFWRVALHRMD